MHLEVEATLWLLPWEGEAGVFMLSFGSVMGTASIPTVFNKHQDVPGSVWGFPSSNTTVVLKRKEKRLADTSAHKLSFAKEEKQCESPV